MHPSIVCGIYILDCLLLLAATLCQYSYLELSILHFLLFLGQDHKQLKVRLCRLGWVTCWLQCKGRGSHPTPVLRWANIHEMVSQVNISLSLADCSQFWHNAAKGPSGIYSWSWHLKLDLVNAWSSIGLSLVYGLLKVYVLRLRP